MSSDKPQADSQRPVPRRMPPVLDYLKEQAADTESAEPGGPVSARAFLLGTALCLLIGVGTIYGNAIVQGTYMAWCFSNPVALFLFFYLVLGNLLIAALARGFALRREELVLIFAMMMMSASIPTFGLVEHLLPMITGVFYYANPENDWAELIQPHVPAWIAPREESLIQGFYEGLPPGAPIPWEGWLESLGWWSVFLMALWLVSISIMVILRRPWIQGERLLYPIMQVPIEMVDGGSGARRSVGHIFRQPQMWLGFALPALVATVNGLSSYHPGLPSFGWGSGLSLFDGTIDIPFRFSFSLIGFSFFISRNLALSIWLFFLVTQFEQGIFNTFGLRSPERLGWYSNPDSPYLTHQAFGAMMVFALYTLWKARAHLTAVARRAGGLGQADDGEEIMSYRAAAITLLLGLAVMVAWLEAAGIPLLAAFLLAAVALLIFLALTRIVAEAGVALARAPYIAPDFVMATMGKSFLGSGGLTGLAYCYPWTADIVTFPMASCANNLKMIHEIVRGRKRVFFWGMVLALAVTLAGACWIILYLSYRHGGINLDNWFWLNSSDTPLAHAAAMMKNPSTTGLGGWLFTGFGAALMGVLVAVHQRVMWWPVHPLGLAMTGTIFTSGVMWFNVFLAWAVKGVVLKCGGGELYRKARSFFAGMILGSFVSSGTWLVIDALTGKQGNFVLVW